MMKHILLVAFGGGIGSVLRYLTSIWFAKYFSSVFPLATFSVNILGCFIIGFLIHITGYFTSISHELKLILIIGFCGGYTTFSSFSLENMKLLEAGQYLLLFIYIVASILGGLLALWLGIIVSKLIL